MIFIIVLLLGLGLPAFNSMTKQSRLAKTRQLLEGVTTRAHILSVADRARVAVRCFPAGWDVNDKGEPASAAETRGQQALATYKWSASSQNPDLNDPDWANSVVYTERFERLKGGPSAILPPDTWVAPVEALVPSASADRDGNGVPNQGDDNLLDELTGVLGTQAPERAFSLECDRRTDAGIPLLNADDFLLVFDPDIGLVSGARPPRPAWAIKAYNPQLPSASQTGQRETAGEGWNNNTRVYATPFERFNYSGVVIYQREPFASLGVSAMTASQVQARRDMLRRIGTAFFVNRSGGGLIEGGEQ